MTRFLSLLTALLLTLGAAGAALGAEVDCDAVYCFSNADFAESEEAVTGICITGLPESSVGTVMLGSRVLKAGEILAADQIDQMTFCPLRTQEDAEASVTYLPIYADHVASAATMTISIRGKEDKAPIAEDFAAETYKNLPLEGTLKVKDPEEQALTYTIVRQPKRGEVTIQADGSFTYTPKKNKVGVDSFVYTATDPAGNVSREATVTITIVKPTDSKQYTDTLGKSCRFAAEWMKNTGIFVGESLDGNACFYPDREVTKGEFLTMLVKALDIPTDTQTAVYSDTDVPTWLQPYLTAAVRSGLTAGLTDAEAMDYDGAFSGAEAAVILQNALDLSASTDVQTAAIAEEMDYAAISVMVLAENGITLSPADNLTRGEAAEILYQTVQLAQDAPGMLVLQAQK